MLDIETEIEELKDTNEYLRDKLKLVNEKLRASLTEGLQQRVEMEKLRVKVAELEGTLEMLDYRPDE